MATESPFRAGPEGLPSNTGSRRRPWDSLPRSVSTGVEAIVQGRVVAAWSQPGGFSEGLAARLELADGRRVFAKAVDAANAPSVAAFHRRELAVAQRLPAGIPAPRLVGGYDDGEWVALVFEEIDGALPEQPWREDELERVLDALTSLAERLTPAPSLNVALAAPRLGGWTRIADSPAALAKLTEVAAWVGTDLDRHQALEAQLDEAIAGSTLVHGDAYPFNILLTSDRVVFVDWPHAWIGPAHADLVMLLGSVALSGIDPEPFASRHRLLAGVDAEAVDVLISAQAGFLLAAACSAESTADPRLVDMMTRLGLVSLRWLSRRNRRE